MAFYNGNLAASDVVFSLKNSLSYVNDRPAGFTLQDKQMQIHLFNTYEVDRFLGAGVTGAAFSAKVFYYNQKTDEKMAVWIDESTGELFIEPRRPDGTFVTRFRVVIKIEFLNKARKGLSTAADNFIDELYTQNLLSQGFAGGASTQACLSPIPLLFDGALMRVSTAEFVRHFFGPQHFAQALGAMRLDQNTTLAELQVAVPLYDVGILVMEHLRGETFSRWVHEEYLHRGAASTLPAFYEQMATRLQAHILTLHHLYAVGNVTHHDCHMDNVMCTPLTYKYNSVTHIHYPVSRTVDLFIPLADMNNQIPRLLDFGHAYYDQTITDLRPYPTGAHNAAVQGNRLWLISEPDETRPSKRENDRVLKLVDGQHDMTRTAIDLLLILTPEEDKFLAVPHRLRTLLYTMLYKRWDGIVADWTDDRTQSTVENRYLAMLAVVDNWRMANHPRRSKRVPLAADSNKRLREMLQANKFELTHYMWEERSDWPTPQRVIARNSKLFRRYETPPTGANAILTFGLKYGTFSAKSMTDRTWDRSVSSVRQ